MPGGFGLFSSRGGVGGGASLPDGVVGAFATVDACVAALEAASTGSRAVLIGQATGNPAATFTRWPVDADPANDVIETSRVDFTQCDGSEFTFGAGESFNFNVATGSVASWSQTHGLVVSAEFSAALTFMGQAAEGEFARVAAVCNISGSTFVSGDRIDAGFAVLPGDPTNTDYTTSSMFFNGSLWRSSAGGNRGGGVSGLQTITGTPSRFVMTAHNWVYSAGFVSWHRAASENLGGIGTFGNPSASTAYTGSSAGETLANGARRPFLYFDSNAGSNLVGGFESLRFEPMIRTFPLEA